MRLEVFNEKMTALDPKQNDAYKFLDANQHKEHIWSE